jgi:hypothetical protein
MANTSEMTAAEITRFYRMTVFRHNFRWARQRFRDMPQSEWPEFKIACRFGPNYYFWKWAQQAGLINATSR